MKKARNIILCGLVMFIILIAVLWVSIAYGTEYKKTICDISISSDEKFKLTLIAVGEPEWPLGVANGRLILEENEKKISQTDFELRNNGGSVNSDCWKVTWYDEYVEVILSGSEQFDEQVILYFNGEKNIKQLTDET